MLKAKNVRGFSFEIIKDGTKTCILAKFYPHTLKIDIDENMLMDQLFDKIKIAMYELHATGNVQY